MKVFYENFLTLLKSRPSNQKGWEEKVEKVQQKDFYIFRLVAVT